MRILLAALLISGTGVSGLPGWVNSCAVFQDEERAMEEVEFLDSIGEDHCGCLWIPDWSSLSGYEGWLVYQGPFESRQEAAGEACGLLWRYPDIYSVAVSGDTGRETSPPVPADIFDLTGLVPPSQDYMLQRSIPRDWDTSVENVGTGEEWEIAFHISSSPPGWSLSVWQDVYLGTVEMRAYENSNEIAEDFERVSSFLRPSAETLGLQVLESPGEWILLHKLPFSEDREGDVDFWAAAGEDRLEYGMRVRSFYGEPVYSWNNIPDSARVSSIPVEVDSFEEACVLLKEKLLNDGVMEPQDLENVSLHREFPNELPRGSWLDHYNIAVRERHRPEGPGDPMTAPVIYRFRVYARGGEVLWANPLTALYHPYSETLDFVTHRGPEDS